MIEFFSVISLESPSFKLNKTRLLTTVCKDSYNEDKESWAFFGLIFVSIRKNSLVRSSENPFVFLVGETVFFSLILRNFRNKRFNVKCKLGFFDTVKTLFSNFFVYERKNFSKKTIIINKIMKIYRIFTLIYQISFCKRF